MMALPKRCQRLEQHEPIAALRNKDIMNLQSMNCSSDLQSNNMAVPAPSVFVSPPSAAHAINPPVAPSAGMHHFVPKLMSQSSSGSPAGDSGVSDDFSNLSLKRVSKALKLISPATNTAIKSSEEMSLRSSFREIEADLNPQVSAGSSGSTIDMARPFSGDGVVDCTSKVPSADLPTGSRLRRWICPDPDSPLKTGETSSSASVASDFTFEKCVSLDRKDTISELEVCQSEDSACAGLDSVPRGCSSLKDDYCLVDIPKASKLWIWMGKKEK